MAQTKRPTRTRKTVKKPPASPAKRRNPPPPAPAAEPAPTLPAVRTATPERAFAARVRPLAPPPPLPSGRRAIFVDVENSSRADHISRVLDHLAIDRHDRRVELIAVGNWRVIGADSARLLARRGAHLVHSAPSTGVRDWSDLRIAVSAGVWLGSARPGDLIEIISDDRAFDAVGDVAAVLGVEYRRLSHRGLSGLAAAEEPAQAEAPAPREGRGRRGGRGRRRGRGRGDHGGRAPMPSRPVPHHAPARPAEPARAPAPETGAQTAPHDQLVDVVRELADHAPNNAVLIDTLARALKERGFSRPPGSPRLITRLRRIRELVVSRTGMITLADAAGGAAAAAAAADETLEESEPTADVVEVDEVDEVDGNVAPAVVGAATGPPTGGGARRGRRRRRRRRRGGGGGGGAAPAPTA
ncbi:MAG TPA: hypothetical protein VL086_02350 [Candidatus Nitrosotalea sp.]|nr:hypothetical protein [Candidatus Nitrosotalea sp.]